MLSPDQISSWNDISTIESDKYQVYQHLVYCLEIFLKYQIAWHLIEVLPIFYMFFQESTFMKIGPYSRSDQTKPNQVVYYKSFIIMSEPTKKNFSSIAPLGAEKIDLEVSKFEKRSF